MENKCSIETNAIGSRAGRDAALQWLMGRINYERTAFVPYNQRQLKLDRMRQLLTRLGQPDYGLKIVHVAGTKGKGSTAAMISAMLTAAGYRCGLFSSPHLERIEERFTVDGRQCTESELIALVDRVRSAVHAMDEQSASEGDPTGGPTYFEITTAMALLHFVECAVDVTVLEVGLGGRLDSTNVCLPAISVITSISFDHMRQLGHTLAAIAREKAGIIKPGVPVVSGVLAPEARQVIAEVAREHGCRLIQLNEDFQFRYDPPEKVGHFDELPNDLHPTLPALPLGAVDFYYTVAGQEFQLNGAPLAMRGPHQAANGAVALAVVAELRHQGWCISSEAMRSGLSQAALTGRVEILARDPLVVIDTAHNPASARALVEALAEFRQPARRTVILSISRDKDVRGILVELVGRFDRFIVTQYQENPRAVPADELADKLRRALAGATAEILVCHTPQEAWQLARQTALPRELLCMTGSFFLAAEIRRLVIDGQRSTLAGVR